ncbi:MAG: agmatine deiminase family protein [Verrucomicrobiota bacterium]
MSPRRKPRELGYRLPAEWEPQEAVWFAWPTREALWPGMLEEVRDDLAKLYVLASKYQQVRVLCPGFMQDDVRERMAEQGPSDALVFYDYETDDIWCRDFGPIFLLKTDGSELAIADWTYNAWGGKFAEQSKDNAANQWIAEQLKVRRFVYETILEGGAIESNGAGGLLTTEIVLLNGNRNAELSQAAIETVLSENLSVDRFYWLKRGLMGDDTDGHIDNLARFFQEDGILIADVTDPDDPNAEALAENYERLRAFRNAKGEPMATVQLPLPQVTDPDGQPLAASYLNYLVLNGAILVPTYGQLESDQRAIDILSDCFPGREVVGFDCRRIIQEGGALHCLSQNQPALNPQ